jgi:hypothetical protein
MLLQFDGLDTIGDFDDDYKDITEHDNIDVLDMDTGALPSDEWLNRDIEDTDIRLRFSAEEQLRCTESLTPISATTDMLTHSLDEPDESMEQEHVVGYDEKLEALAINLDCMFKENNVRWLKTARECRPVELRPRLGCPGPWRIEQL